MIATSVKVSWKTTVLGIIAGLPIILGEIKAVLDDDPDTNFRIENITAALAIMGIGAAARDGDKSSQDHKVRS